MSSKKIIINTIYTIIILLVGVIMYFFIKRAHVKLDIFPPVLVAKMSGSNIILNASDNVGVFAYTYNNTNEIPNEWYEANNKKEFNETLRVVSEGDYYIWVKDEYGNVSNTISFNFTCESGEFVGIDKKVYCPYSSIKAFGYNWHVLEDSDGYLTLFMDSGELKNMSHCSKKESSNYCYYVNNMNYKAYSWGNSMIGYYLNNDFKALLNGVELKDSAVCNDESGVKGCVDNDGCGGYLADEVNSLNNFCESQYIASPIRLLTFMEYNRILKDLERDDKTWVYGKKKFWTMNAWRKPAYASSIDINGVYNVDENSTTELDIRPVIIVKR